MPEETVAQRLVTTPHPMIPTPMIIILDLA